MYSTAAFEGIWLASNDQSFWMPSRLAMITPGARPFITVGLSAFSLPVCPVSMLRLSAHFCHANLFL